MNECIVTKSNDLIKINDNRSLRMRGRNLTSNERKPMAKRTKPWRLRQSQARRRRFILAAQLMNNAEAKLKNASSTRLYGRLIGIPLIAFTLILSGCAQGMNKQMVGAVTGAALGGALGSAIGHGVGKTVATIGGTMAGGLIGGSIGNNMDEVDRLKMNQALEKAPAHQTVSWRNPDSNHEYSVTPIRTSYRQNQPCREYTLSGSIAGEIKQLYGTACRTPDGNWRVASPAR